MRALLERWSPRRAAAIWIASFAIAAALPYALSSGYWLHVLTIGTVYGLLAATWDLLYGLTGVVSFGHAAFFGVGAYAAALASARLGVEPWAGLLIGALAGSVVGLLFNLAAGRLRGTYLALSTLAFAQTMQLIISSATDITRGTEGLAGYDRLAVVGTDPKLNYWTALGVAAIAILVIRTLSSRTRPGLYWRAIRNNPARAVTVGVDVARYRLFALLLSSAIAGLIGAFYAYFVGVVSPSLLDAVVTAKIISIAIIGGVGTIVGPFVAGIGLELATEQMRSFGGAVTTLATGLLIVALVELLPGGLADGIRRIRVGRRAESAARADAA